MSDKGVPLSERAFYQFLSAASNYNTGPKQLFVSKQLAKMIKDLCEPTFEEALNYLVGNKRKQG
jgi:hypothetical protein